MQTKTVREEKKNFLIWVGTVRALDDQIINAITFGGAVDISCDRYDTGI